MKTLSNVSSKYGAPMGRPNVLPDDRLMECKLHLVRLRFVDGDYDEGGAYWGGSYSSIYWAYGDVGDVAAEMFVRARNRNDARVFVRDTLPNAKFYR